jgi:DNA polymerase
MPNPNYVPGMGSPDAKVMVVGEAPGKDEDEQLKPFVGESGQELDALMREAGHPHWRYECYVTNVSKFRPPYNIFSRLHEVASYEEQIAGLWTEIRAIKPNVILALGDNALTALTGKHGITKYRGSILQSTAGVPKVIPTFHPANLVRSRNEVDEFGESTGIEGGKQIFKFVYRKVMVDDIKRAFQESNYEDLKLPQRNLLIAKNSGDVYGFIQRHNGSIPMVDIEAYNCIPVCLSLAFNRYEAMSIPLFRRIGKGVQLCEWTDSDIAYGWNILDNLFRTTPVMGHNFVGYDYDKLRMLGFRFRGIHADTMLLSHTVNPEMPAFSLAYLTSFFTREPYYKDEGKEWTPKVGVKQLFLYNGRDSAVDYEIFEELDKELDILSAQYRINLRKFFYGYVMRLFPLYYKMVSRGVRIDESRRDFIRFKYERWHEEIQNKFLAALGHEVNVNSNPQMQHVVYEELKCPKRGAWDKKTNKFKYSTNEDTLAALMQNQVKDERRRRILSDILEDRRVRKTLGTYVNAEVDFDGRLRTSYRITGTETGRSSTGILKPPLRPSKMGMAFQTITKHGDIGADIREFIVPDKGKVFVNVDKSQAEARVVGVLSKDWDLLDAFNRIDIHRRTAALIFEYTSILDLSDICEVADKIGKDSSERFMGKKTRHAGNYNMKKHRFMTEVTADAKKFGIDIKISEWKAGQILDIFHSANPKIRGVFHSDVRAAIDSGRVLINPFGRIRMFFDRISEELYKEAFAFIPQSTVHDSLTQAWIEIDTQKPDVEWLMESHDSLLFQCREDEVVDICVCMKEEFEKSISFRDCTLSRDYDLVIPMDIEIGYENLSEMKKFKLPKEERAA